MDRVRSSDVELVTEGYDAYLVNRSDRAIARVVFRAGNRYYSRSGTVRREIRDLPPKSYVPLPMVDYCEPGPAVAVTHLLAKPRGVSPPLRRSAPEFPQWGWCVGRFRASRAPSDPCR